MSNSFDLTDGSGGGWAREKARQRQRAFMDMKDEDNYGAAPGPGRAGGSLPADAYSKASRSRASRPLVVLPTSA